MLKQFTFHRFIFVGFSISLLLFFSCNMPWSKNSVVDLKDDAPEQGKVTEMFSSVKFVPLETTDQSRLSEVSESLFYNGVYVFSDIKQKTLMAFDQKGKFLFKIFPKGNGPLKINSITDYTINKKSNTIDVYDFSQKKIVSFGFDGNAKSEKSVKYLFREFASTSNGDYVLYAPDLPNEGVDMGAFIVDSNGKLKHSFLKTTINQTYIQPINCLSGFGDSIALVSNYSKDIYRINNNVITKPYTLETGNEWERNFILSYGSGSLLNFVYRKNTDDPKSSSVFLNASTGKQYHLDYLINDLFLIPITIPYLFKDSHTLLAFINVEQKKQLLEVLDKDSSKIPTVDKKLVNELKAILSALKMSDNFVMVELHAKI